MKKIQRTLCVILGTCTFAKATVVTSMSDLTTIIGTGANQAGLVIDFNDGSSVESFAWGYRWDGIASGEDLLSAVVAADPNLSVDSTSFIQTISYFDGATLHNAVSDFGGGAVSWGYYLAGGTSGDDNPGNPGGVPISILGAGSALPSSWTIANTGTSLVSFGDSGRILEDGSWDGFSFGAFDTATFDHLISPGPEAPTAVAIPEPGSLSFFLILASCGVLRRRRHR